jgi:geranylgeranyl pyrophosphate synthase
MKSQLAAAAPFDLLFQMLSDQFAPEKLSQLLGAGAGKLGQAHWEKALSAPLSDFLERPGKEFRAALVETAYRLVRPLGDCPPALPKLVEIIHAGSLIVDDIQDDSKTRRGAPCLHVTYGLPVALNAGNWLYFWAFALVEELELDPLAQLQVYKALSRTMFACHYGQGLDLTARVTDLPQQEVAHIVETSTRLKTGALMSFAAALGAIAGGADTRQLDALAHFGMQLGLGLQMLDDVGGLLNEKRWLKGAEDLTLGRPTWPWAWLATDLSANAYADLRTLAGAARDGQHKLDALAKHMRHELRGSGRVRVRRHLQAAFAELSETFGASPELELIEQETQRLEKSYG